MSTTAHQTNGHHISSWRLPPTEMVSSIEEADRIIEQEITATVRTLKSLPESVSALTHMIHNEFSKTADLCRANADKLRQFANDLDERARKLDAAAPDVAASIEEWTSFENETNDAMNKLGVILRR